MKECTMTAKTVEEAIELACDRIGLPREEVEIEIIDLPKKGFFGIGAQPAKVFAVMVHSFIKGHLLRLRPVISGRRR